MIFQYVFIAVVLVACLWYATFRLVKSYRDNVKCKDYKCSGCPFLEKCEKKRKKVGKKFGGTE